MPQKARQMWHPTDVFMTLGRRGMGKTYLGEQIRRAYPRVVTFDTIHEHSDGEIFYSFFEFSERVLHAAKTGEKEFHFIVRFDLEKEDNKNVFNESLRILFHMGGVFIRIEEIQQLSSPHTLPLWLKNLLTMGRHRKIGMLFSTQMPRYCNKGLISQASHVFCGQLHEKADIEYVRSVLGDRAFELKDLPARKFLYFSPGLPIRLVNNSLD